MNIADLFVTIGVKGKDDVKKSLTNVEKGLGEIKSTSLAAKAAILGLLYGVEQLFSKSANKGNDLMTFGAFTGESMKTMQQWQQVALDTGQSAEEMKNSVMNVQKTLNDLDIGKAAPEGLAYILDKYAQLTGKEVDLNFAKDSKDGAMYMMDVYKTVAKLTDDSDKKRNWALSSVGLSPSTIVAMATSKEDVHSIKKNVLSDAQLKQMQKVKIHMDQMWAHVQNKVDNFTSKHGDKLIGQISMIVDKVADLTEKLITLAEKLKVFELIGKIFEGWTEIFDQLNSAVDDLNKPKKESFMTVMKNALHDAIEHPFTDDRYHKRPGSTLSPIQKNVTPHVKGGHASNISQDKTVNVAVNNYGLKDTGESVADIKREVSRAFNSMSNQFTVA